MSRALWFRLLVASLLPTLATVAGVSLFSWGFARGLAEEALSERLRGTAQVIAAQLRAEDARFLRPGDEEGRTHRRVRGRLLSAQEAAQAARVSLLDLEGALLADTLAGTPIGAPLPALSLDRLEFEAAAAGTAGASLALFRGADDALYHHGYAPVLGPEGPAAVVRVQASAAYFEGLARLGRGLGLAALVGLLAAIAAAALGARSLSRPIEALAAAATRIGSGDLATPLVPRAQTRELRALEESLERMRAALAERDAQTQMMVAGVAHEVRNPLGGIDLFSGLLFESLEGDAPRQAQVSRIRAELGRLGALVDDFLAFARQGPAAPTWIPLRPLADEVIELLAARAQERGLRVWVEGPAAEAWADPEPLRRALLNLVQNALQAAPPEGQVRLTLAPGCLVVEDDGEGVDPAQAEQIFQPFFTTRAQGTGLGLALARRAARAHGGELSVDRGPLGGARFTLTLPPPPAEGGTSGPAPVET